MAADSIALPDVRALWSADVDAVQAAAEHVADVLQDDPTSGVRMLVVLRDPPSSEPAWSYEALDNVMLSLEELADRQRTTALLLMICLHGPAAECADAHDVCDAIDLWIAESDDPEVDRFLATHREFAERKAHLRGLAD
jgi:hypothetical protein